MAYGDNAIDWANANITAAVARAEKLHLAKAVETPIGGTTSEWFRPGVFKLEGKRHFYRMFTQSANAARMMGWGAAVISEGVVSRDFAWTEFSLSHDDLFRCETAGKWNWNMDELTKDPQMAVAKLATEIVTQMKTGVKNRKNIGIMQSQTCALTKIVVIYDYATIGGDSYATFTTGGGQYAAAYIQIEPGMDCRFARGMVLDIYDAVVTGAGTKNITVKVLDVVHGKHGPTIAGVRRENLGPGIIVQNCSTAGVVGTTAWNAVAVPATGDFIALSGEFATPTTCLTAPNNFHGLPDWFDSTVDCWRDNAGTVVDREATGNTYLNPMWIAPSGASAGSEVAFDMRTHFRELEDALPFKVLIENGRGSRIGADLDTDSEHALKINGSALMFVTTNHIANEAVDEAQSSLQFTTTAKMDAETREKLFGRVGFSGISYQSPTGLDIAIVADPNCVPYRGYLIEPSSFQWIDWAESANALHFVPFPGGGNIWPVFGTNGRPTEYLQMRAYENVALLCDQPGVNVEFRHIKASTQ